ncbi:MAG: hypothetical protein RLY30_29 [Pseudomonadota bacterium]
MSLTTFIEIAFILAILGVTAYFHVRFDRFSVTHGPEVLTTMGILGCFTGITIALFSFNPNDIQSGVPMLLGGIRTAFWASLAGVFGALTLRFAQRFRPIAEEANVEAGPEEATLGDVVAAVQGLKKNLSTELDLSRQDANQHASAFIQEFRAFSAHMVENNQKAIIEALKEVIRDFNDKLSEQFGENFKQLNQAVERLLTWQEQYRQELNLLQEKQQAATGHLGKAADTLGQIVQSAGAFERVAQALQEQIQFLQSNRELLVRQQQSMAQLLQRMSDVTPTFAEKTDAMLIQISTGLDKIGDHMATLSQEMSDRMLDSHREMRQLVMGTAQAGEQELAKVQAAMAQATENLGVQLQMVQQDFKKQMQDHLQASNEASKKALRESVDLLKEGVVTLDHTLQKELEAALQGLAGQLAALSNRFVEDYMPLTERLRDVVQMSKRI